MFKKDRKLILYISSGLYKEEKQIDILDYFAKLLASLAVKLKSALPEYDLVVKIPANYSSEDEQEEILDEFIKKSWHERYSAIIIAPKKRSSIISKLISIRKTYPDYPIFAIDKGFEAKEYKDLFKNQGVDPPFSVQADWEQGGKIAARCYFEYLKTIPEIPQPYSTIVVNGLEGSQERVRGFQNELDNLGVQTSTVIINSDFTRLDAQSRFITEYKKLVAKNIKVTGIFCCNDEMALGVKDALEEVHETNATLHKPKIIGFDSIRDLTIYLDPAMKLTNDFLINSVTVNVPDQISRLVTTLKLVLRKETLYEDILNKSELVKCNPYLRKYNHSTIDTNGI